MRKNYFQHLFILVSICMFLAGKCFCQFPENSYPGNQNETFSHLQSPQAEDFTKKATAKVSLFTGETNVNIPLYTYKDADFEIPISVDYNSSGFDPNRREGIVGLNWSLNAGGAITRIVNNFPDERMKTGLTELELNGTYYASQHNSYYRTLSKNDIFALSAGSINGASVWNIQDCEVDPDDFSFYMPGHGGQFHIQNDGTGVVSDNKPYKIDFLNFGVNQFTYSTIESDEPGDFTSEILITTDDGYKYYFGGGLDFLEYTMNMVDFNDMDESSAPVITTWLLRQIEAPNGRKVDLSYKIFDKGFKGNHAGPSDEHHYYLNINRYCIADWQNLCTEFGNNTYCNYSDAGSGTSLYSTELIKISYLDGISIDENVQISFDYSEKDSKFYNSPLEPAVNVTPFNLAKNYKLDTIKIKYNNSAELIKKISFDIQYVQGANDHSGRFFLSSLTETGSNPYHFEYYDENKIEDPLESGIDYWGYLNGYLQPGSYLIPPSKYYQNGDVEYNRGNIREPANWAYKVGLLEKIIYPTTGWTNFIYQPHDYSKRLERRAVSKFMPALFDANGFTGGARIFQIHDYDGINENINFREYKYVNDFINGGNQSSGILLEWPRYLIYWEYHNGYDQYTLRRRSTSFNRNHANAKNIVQYKEVTEVLKPELGCTNYKFTNFETHPDRSDNMQDTTFANLEYVTPLDSYNNYVGLKLNDNSYERGIPYLITKYSKNNNSYRLIHSSLQEFPQYPNYRIDYTVGVFQTGGLYQSYKNYSCQYFPNKQTDNSYTYDPNGVQHQITKSTQFEYTKNNKITIKTETNSDGKVFSEKYKYIADIDFTPMTSNCISTYLNCKQVAWNTFQTCWVGCQSVPFEQRPQCIQNCSDNYESDTSACNSAYTTCLNGIDLPVKTRIIFDMQRKHMIGLPVETQKLADNKAVGGKIFEYSSFPGGAFGYIYKPKIELSLNTANPITNCQQIHLDNQSILVYDSQYAPQLNYVNYNAKGNPLEIFKENDIHTAYIWGYNDTYPVITAENVTFSVLNDAVVNAAPNSLVSLLDQIGDMTTVQQKDAWKTFNTNLRAYSGLSNALVTTYTYKPLVGITSSTDPNGIPTYYEYDAFGRLIIVRDNGTFGGNIVKKYDYHYAPPSK